MGRIWAIGVIVAMLGCQRTEPTGESASPGTGNSSPVGSKIGVPTSQPIAIQPGAIARARVQHLDVTALPVWGQWFAVWVTTQDETKSSQFRAWSLTLSSIPPLQDDLGNTYRARHAEDAPGDADTRYGGARFFTLDASFALHREFGKTLPAGRYNGSGQVTHDSARCDLIAFDRILAKSRHVILQLPAENVGGVGLLRLEFDAEKVRETGRPNP